MDALNIPSTVTFPTSPEEMLNMTSSFISLIVTLFNNPDGVLETGVKIVRLFVVTMMLSLLLSSSTRRNAALCRIPVSDISLSVVILSVYEPM